MPVYPGPGGSSVTANAGTNLNTSALALESGGHLAAIDTSAAASKTDLDTIVTNTNKIPASPATEGGNLATIVTNTNKIPASPAQEGGNLATLAGAVSSSKVQTQQQVATSGGSIPYHNLTAASTNFTNTKNAATQLYRLKLSNTSASTIFVKTYDKATTPGTGDTPKSTTQIPANSTVIITVTEGEKYVNGFGWAATGAVGDADNTAIAANCVVDFNLST